MVQFSITIISKIFQYFLSPGNNDFWERDLQTFQLENRYKTIISSKKLKLLLGEGERVALEKENLEERGEENDFNWKPEEGLWLEGCGERLGVDLSCVLRRF